MLAALAIAAFVSAFVFTPLAIPLGHVARSQIRETGEQGSGLATAGLVIAYIWVTVIVGALVYMIAPELCQKTTPFVRPTRSHSALDRSHPR